jgi:hypothetical protein
LVKVSGRGPERYLKVKLDSGYLRADENSAISNALTVARAEVYAYRAIVFDMVV